MKNPVNAILVGLLWAINLNTVWVVNSVSVPISQGSSGSRAFTVSSSVLLHQLQDHDDNSGNNEVSSSDNSYDDAITASANNSTVSTALLLGQILKHEEGRREENDSDEDDDEDEHHFTVDFLGKVKNPGVVAVELENAAKYLTHQAELEEHGKGVGSNNATDNAGVADLTRVLDGFVLFNNLYDSLVRPEGGTGRGKKRRKDDPTLVDVQMIVHPWFTVNEARNEMSVTVTIIQNWTDSRVSYYSRLKEKDPSKLQDVTLTSYMHVIEVWLPDTFIVNEKRSTVVSDLLRISPYGDVCREHRVSVVLSCPFHRNKQFPFDSPACSINLASFSWNSDQVSYRWTQPHDFFSKNQVEYHSGGFTLTHTNAYYKSVNQQNKQAVSLEFVLRRKLAPYVTKFYLPLVCFCLVAIGGMVKRVGEGVGMGLSYFVFGLTSIFMGIQGKELNYTSERTQLDSYYLACVVFILGTGIVHLFRLKQKTSAGNIPPKASSLSPSTPARFPEAESSADGNTLKSTRVKSPRNGSSSSSSNTNPTTAISRLWDNEDDNDDDEYNEDTTDIHHRRQYLRGGWPSCLKRLRTLLLRIYSTLSSWWIRIIHFSTPVFLGLFLCWNVYYYCVNSRNIW